MDNSVVRQIGPIKEGDQLLKVKVLSGRFSGRNFESANHLMGKLELDKFFAPGDRAFIVLDLSPDRKEVAYANVIDHFRLDVLATLGVVAVLTGGILFLVGGMNRKSLAAFLGSMGGILLTAILAEAVTRALRLNGATRPFSEALLYAGYGYLDLRGLFISGIFLASSGAILDVGMDIAAAMDEIVVHNPAVSRKALLASGFKVGRLVLGTQTTTLLLVRKTARTAAAPTQDLEAAMPLAQAQVAGTD